MKIVRYYPRAAVGDGGITGSVRRWSAASARAGERAVIAFDGGTPPAEQTGVQWLAVRHAGPEGWRVPIGLHTAIQDADVLVLHSAWTLNNATAGRAAARAHIPYILEPRGAYDPGILARHRRIKHAWWDCFERPLVQHAAAIHVFFESEITQLRRLGWRGPVVVAPNGVAIPEKITWDGGRGGYWLWIGRFDPEHKGLTLLLHAYAQLAAHERLPLRLYGPDWRGGKERTLQTVEALGLNACVQVGAPVYGAEKWQLLQSAAAFVYPSQWEAFGNSTAEAVAAGVPTLVTPYPLGRFLGERGSALLCEASVEGLVSGLRQLRSPNASAMARRGAQLVRQELSWSRVTETWLNQVRSIVH